MMIVTWILKIYCNLVRAGFAKNDWDSYKKYQDLVLSELQKIYEWQEYAYNKYFLELEKVK